MGMGERGEKGDMRVCALVLCLGMCGAMIPSIDMCDRCVKMLKSNHGCEAWEHADVTEQEFQAEHFLDEACREWIARQEQDDCVLRAREACGLPGWNPSLDMCGECLPYFVHNGGCEAWRQYVHDHGNDQGFGGTVDQYMGEETCRRWVRETDDEMCSDRARELCGFDPDFGRRWGCMDPIALNYDPDATEHHGDMCHYEEPECTSCGSTCIVQGDMAGMCDNNLQCSFDYDNLGCEHVDDYHPCADKSEGDHCTLCPPDALLCAETAEQKSCQFGVPESEGLLTCAPSFEHVDTFFNENDDQTQTENVGNDNNEDNQRSEEENQRNENNENLFNDLLNNLDSIDI